MFLAADKRRSLLIVELRSRFIFVELIVVFIPDWNWLCFRNKIIFILGFLPCAWGQYTSIKGICIKTKASTDGGICYCTTKKLQIFHFLIFTVNMTFITWPATWGRFSVSGNWANPVSNLHRVKQHIVRCLWAAAEGTDVPSLRNDEVIFGRCRELVVFLWGV